MIRNYRMNIRYQDMRLLLSIIWRLWQIFFDFMGIKRNYLINRVTKNYFYLLWYIIKDNSIIFCTWLKSKCCYSDEDQYRLTCKLICQHAPDPFDINWVNIADERGCIFIRLILFNLLIFSTLLFITTPYVKVKLLYS